MKRYGNIDKKKDKETNNLVYETNIYPEIPLDNNDIYVWSKVGDRLDMMANRFYQNPRLWWIIAQANNLGEGGFNIPPATRLRIPTNISKILNDLTKFNKER